MSDFAERLKKALDKKDKDADVLKEIEEVGNKAGAIGRAMGEDPDLYNKVRGLVVERANKSWEELSQEEKEKLFEEEKKKTKEYEDKIAEYEKREKLFIETKQAEFDYKHTVDRPKEIDAEIKYHKKRVKELEKEKTDIASKADEAKENFDKAKKEYEKEYGKYDSNKV